MKNSNLNKIFYVKILNLPGNSSQLLVGLVVLNKLIILIYFNSFDTFYKKHTFHFSDLFLYLSFIANFLLAEEYIYIFLPLHFKLNIYFLNNKKISSNAWMFRLQPHVSKWKLFVMIAYSSHNSLLNTMKYLL